MVIDRLMCAKVVGRGGSDGLDEPPSEVEIFKMKKSHQTHNLGALW